MFSLGPHRGENIPLPLDIVLDLLAREGSLGLESMEIKKCFFQEKDIFFIPDEHNSVSARKKKCIKYNKVSTCAWFIYDPNSCFLDSLEEDIYPPFDPYSSSGTNVLFDGSKLLVLRGDIPIVVMPQ